MTSRLGGHAIVVGGSMTGLMVASVLARHFDQVTVLERDPVEDRPARRRSTPQASQYHVLLRAGLEVLQSLFPEFIVTLDAAGSVRTRVCSEVAYHTPQGKAHSLSGLVREPRDLGFDVQCQSRDLLEHCLRRCAGALPNVTLRAGSAVAGLVVADGRVRGVRASSPRGTQELHADLVVDAGGRGTHAIRWLRQLGYPTPEETHLRCDFAYTTTKFRIPASYQEPENINIFFGPAPQCITGAIMHRIEGGVWHAAIMGRLGTYPPRDEAGYRAFARDLWTPTLHRYIRDAERVDDLHHYRFPSSVQRHWERLPALPENFLLVGDAIASINPYYGQGMSWCALQVRALREVLAARAATGSGLDGVAREFFPIAAEIAFSPWNLAALSDLTFEATPGDRPPGFPEQVRYFTAVDALTADDPEVHRFVAEVLNLCRPVTALFDEPLRSRALERLAAAA